MRDKGEVGDSVWGHGRTENAIRYLKFILSDDEPGMFVSRREYREGELLEGHRMC